MNDNPKDNYEKTCKSCQYDCGFDGNYVTCSHPENRLKLRVAIGYVRECLWKTKKQNKIDLETT